MFMYFYLFIFLCDSNLINTFSRQVHNYSYDLTVYKSHFQDIEIQSEIRNYKILQENYLKKEVLSETVDYKPKRRDCSYLSRTEYSPFVAFVLFKSSGRFLGMSAIIDRMTLITALKVIDSHTKYPGDLLILAGSLSPWWGRDSQVRRVANVVRDRGDVALLQLKNRLVFNDRISPISLQKRFISFYTGAYGSFYGVFGIFLHEDVVGNEVAKGKTYTFGIQSAKFSGLCDAGVSGTRNDFHHKYEVCLMSNVSFCEGSLGSPVVAMGERNKLNLVGVLIVTGCLEQSPYLRAVKLSHLDKWIKANSLLGYDMQKGGIKEDDKEGN